MAHGLNSVLRRGPATVGCKSEGKSGIGSRRIFAPHFKLQVLDSYRNDADCKGNQRATARKYGIHRRQIQKWLQCENNLRNSVGKSKAANPEARKCGVELSLRSGQHRQRDDLCADAYSQSPTGQEALHVCGDAYNPIGQEIACSEAYSHSVTGQEARVPVSPGVIAPGAPLDYTMHSRSYAASPVDHGAPMDLSFKRPAASGDTSAPVCCPLSPCTPHIQRVPSPSCLVPLVQTHPDIWDLSVRGQKRYHDDTISISTHPPNLPSPAIESQPKPIKLFKPYLDDFHDEKPKDVEVIPPCCNRYIHPLPENESLFYNNNNHILPDYSYTLHELQPKNTINYYYTINKNYIYGGECDGMSFCNAYDGSGLLHHPSSPPLKQRQSYSLDFKLRTIECYYQDSMCRGNQRAVASKYNIHRRQVQKWLKQEDELRHRNDPTTTNKQMNVVR